MSVYSFSQGLYLADKGFYLINERWGGWQGGLDNSEATGISGG